MASELSHAVHGTSVRTGQGLVAEACAQPHPSSSDSSVSDWHLEPVAYGMAVTGPPGELVQRLVADTPLGVALPPSPFLPGGRCCRFGASCMVSCLYSDRETR